MMNRTTVNADLKNSNLAIAVNRIASAENAVSNARMVQAFELDHILTSELWSLDYESADAFIKSLSFMNKQAKSRCMTVGRAFELDENGFTAYAVRLDNGAVVKDFSFNACVEIVQGLKLGDVSRADARQAVADAFETGILKGVTPFTSIKDIRACFSAYARANADVKVPADSNDNADGHDVVTDEKNNGVTRADYADAMATLKAAVADNADACAAWAIVAAFVRSLDGYNVNA